MIVKTKDDKKPEEDTGEIRGESKNIRHHTIYSFPDPTKTKVWGAPRIDFKPFEARALAEITKAIEQGSGIRADEADGIFKKHAEADHELPSEGRLDRILGRYVNTGRMIKTREMQKGKVTSDSSALIPKVRAMKGDNAEYWDFVVELHKKFDISDERARYTAHEYSLNKRRALFLLKSFMPEASFDGLDMLVRHSESDDCSTLVKKPFKLQKFFEKAHANMAKSLSGVLQKVSKNGINEFISKTPLDELPELIKTIKQRTVEVRELDDEEFARFLLREKRIIAAGKSKS